MSLLSLQNITKDFPGVRALENVSFDLSAGQIHALVGENGAGKSTLIKVLGGVWPYGSYEGKILVDGKPARFHGVRDSENAQIRTIHQELSLVNQMSVAENIFLGHEPRSRGIIDHTAMRRGARDTLAMLGAGIAPDTLVSDCSIGEQQVVEIAKALSKKARIIVFDEPTAALPEKDVRNLLRLIRDLKARGLGIIYISHKLAEVCEIADTVTVLRNGRTVSHHERDALNLDRIVADMIGRSLDTVFPPLADADTEPLLRLDDVTLPHPTHTGHNVLDSVLLQVRRGEVVGIAGLLGSGRTALLSLLFGVYRGSHSGSIRFAESEYMPRSPLDAIARGIALVTEDRKRYGLVGTADVRDNLSLASLRQCAEHGWIDDSRVTAFCNEYVRRLDIKAPSLTSAVANLSGGNQQKVVLGRFLMTKPRLLLLDDPTRGIDVGAKYEIYRLIHVLAQDGIGILFVSSELPEVLGVCHRVAVLRGGKVCTTFGHGERSEEQTLALAAGV